MKLLNDEESDLSSDSEDEVDKKVDANSSEPEGKKALGLCPCGKVRRM